MPHSFTRSRLFRGKSINPNPPWCRPPLYRRCRIESRDCATDTVLSVKEWDDISLDDCRARFVPILGRKNRMTWQRVKGESLITEDVDLCVTDNWIRLLSYGTTDIRFYMHIINPINGIELEKGLYQGADMVWSEPPRCNFTLTQWQWTEITPYEANALVSGTMETPVDMGWATGYLTHTFVNRDFKFGITWGPPPFEGDCQIPLTLPPYP